MRPAHRRVSTAVAALPLALTVLAVSRTPASAAMYRVVSRRTVARGVVFTKLVESSPQNHIFVLRVNLSKRPSLDVGLAARALGGFERTSSMASRYGAVAAINGDFTEWWGRPAHAFAQDGTFEFTAMRGGPQLAVSRDERTGFVGLSTPRIEAWLPHVTTPMPVTRWNAGSPAGSALAAYSPVGVPKSPDGTCGVKVRGSGPPSWTAGKAAVTRKYRVGRRRCGIGLTTRHRLVLAANASTTSATRLQSLRRGQTLKVSWTLGWPDVHETIGGFPVLVSAGRAVATAACASYFCGRNPRTGVGLTPKGRLLLVVVDGRRPGWSSGMRLDEFANLFRYLGADRAMNLDGGGSSTMVVRGRVVNRPSDSTGERPVSSSLLIRSGYDPGDPKQDLTAPPESPSAVSSWDAARAALDDPASTGGMLEVLETQR